MADTVYFLSSREQSRLVSTLNLSKVERLSVQPGQLGDESVELVIEHSLDFLPGTCVDHYALQRGGDAISIQKEFCPGFITKERRTEVVQQTGNSAKWFQLQSPLIFDVKASPKAPSSWGIAKETVKGFSSSEMMWSFANQKIHTLRRLWAFPKQDPLSRKVFERVSCFGKAHSFLKGSIFGFAKDHIISLLENPLTVSLAIPHELGALGEAFTSKIRGLWS